MHTISRHPSSASSILWDKLVRAVSSCCNPKRSTDAVLCAGRIAKFLDAYLVNSGCLSFATAPHSFAMERKVVGRFKWHLIWGCAAIPFTGRDPQLRLGEIAC